ncbi:Trimeric GatFAB AmidoTransferase(AdT) complex subunit [Didymosphaeria variabile]|uniref:Glutamyl-tRNA(Gln) amidotransferase subunit A, mitochondrial n=1 Tax=Didymosphaeria variabile TaxID=1932322 RepID=A0A9W8XH82_9PLEO|nr:Trimeric GatFAB AmidoTransferase(AdT) complex subunit [Didymosphaeria variabile]KAJ4349622.1 Trimeric GatFAB AmidoTransferase(AdT) complex subunit [Didymosphaeria variabile]
MSLLRHAQRHIENIGRYAHLNAFVNTADADSIHARVATAVNSSPTSNVDPRSPHGRLIAIKDNICTADTPTMAASRILKKFNSPYDATVVRQLREAGATVVGKTNMDEFGMGSHNIHSHFGRTKFEHKGEDRSAGGSSGGSAVAVATGQCWAALGTDTGGSVRLPAAYTGTIGFKPSYGLLSRWGVIAYANSLDTVGILGNDVESVEGLFDVTNKYDHQDPTSLDPSTRLRLPTEGPTPSKPLRIGVPIDYNISTLDPTVRKAWLRSLRHLQQRGHSLHKVQLPATQHALSAYYVLAPAEASSNLAKYDGIRYGSRAEGKDGTADSVLFAKTRGEGFGPEVQRRILLGAFSLSAQAMDNYFIQAQKVRRLVQQDFDRVFATPNPLLTSQAKVKAEGVDVLLCPTAPTLAPRLSEIQVQKPLDAYMNDVFTVPASLAGLPAISVPAQGDNAVDTEGSETAGMQLIGQYGDDKLVLALARQLLNAAKAG